MYKIISAILALGIMGLCDPPTKPGPFDGKTNLIKVDGVICGTFSSLQNTDFIELTDLVLDKHKLGLLFSGGFVVKQAQRVGFVIEYEENGQSKWIENCWIEAMSQFQEQPETISIKTAICVHENQEEPPQDQFMYKIVGDNSSSLTFYSNNFSKIINNELNIHAINASIDSFKRIQDLSPKALTIFVFKNKKEFCRINKAYIFGGSFNDKECDLTFKCH
jgi:hypothetical protein